MKDQEKKAYTAPEVVAYGNIAVLTGAAEAGSHLDGNYNYGDAPDPDGDGILNILS